MGDADITGVEAELVVRPSGGLQLDLSAGWLDFDYKRINPATGIRPGMTNVYTPEFTASAGLSYAIPFGSAGTLTPRIDYNYRSKISTEAVNGPSTDIAGRGVADARVTWTSLQHAWDATLAVTNVTDKFYYESLTGRVAAPYFSATGRPARPREWLFTVCRSFD